MSILVKLFSDGSDAANVASNPGKTSNPATAFSASRCPPPVGSELMEEGQCPYKPQTELWRHALSRPAGIDCTEPINFVAPSGTTNSIMLLAWVPIPSATSLPCTEGVRLLHSCFCEPRPTGNGRFPIERYSGDLFSAFDKCWLNPIAQSHWNPSPPSVTTKKTFLAPFRSISKSTL